MRQGGSSCLAVPRSLKCAAPPAAATIVPFPKPQGGCLTRQQPHAHAFSPPLAPGRRRQAWPPRNFPPPTAPLLTHAANATHTQGPPGIKLYEFTRAASGATAWNLLTGHAVPQFYDVNGDDENERAKQDWYLEVRVMRIACVCVCCVRSTAPRF